MKEFLLGVVCFLSSVGALALFGKSCEDHGKRLSEEIQKDKEFAYKCHYNGGEIVGTRCFKEGKEFLI
jgi:hypothetical protein